MDAVFFSMKGFERSALGPRLEGTGVEACFLEARLDATTAALAEGARCVSVFVNDVCDAGVIGALASGGTEFLALRSAGFNHVDLEAAASRGVSVMRVPAYSPHGVAEHAAGLLLALNRRIHKAYNRVREGDFSIDGLMGFDLHGKTVGVVGTGKIGEAFARIAVGFGCEVVGYDPWPSDSFEAAGGRYVGLEELLERSRVVSLHCPLTPETHHMIGEEALGRMRDDAVLINTSRGGLVDTAELIDALKRERIGAVGIDVYEEEENFFFRDLSDRVLTDDALARLLTFPNVVVTSHQGFFTREAVEAIADVTVENVVGALRSGASGVSEGNLVRVREHSGAGS